MHKAMTRQNEECLKEIRRISGSRDEVAAKVSAGQLYPQVDLKHDKGE
jgi:hypothetical protein